MILNFDPSKWNHTRGSGITQFGIRMVLAKFYMLVHIVIMEGNPHPGAVKGRMSFQNFNPSIDKLNGEARGDCQTESASPSNYHQDSANSSRGDEVLASRFRDSNIDSSESISLNELKRKQPELEMETPPSHKLPKATGRNVDGGSSSQSNGHGSRNSNKREKFDFNLLRPKKSK
ncbi:uncharacterized protein LOC133892428 isoform X3 [Phragmites australis]|uniref:uncharacterized protein LOC133892428 isoform X3 n=1 Tax=Phragmites australis TaxID=29695 RepID=UPI002D77878F|nr:uncharacterized protein LOC133892428 isoform X3 [Phragmites australis]